jgi:hypothetical protein
MSTYDSIFLEILSKRSGFISSIRRDNLNIHKLSDHHVHLFKELIFIINVCIHDNIVRYTFIQKILLVLLQIYESDYQPMNKIFDIVIGNAILFNDNYFLTNNLSMFITESYIQSIIEKSQYTDPNDLIMYRAFTFLSMDFDQIILDNFEIQSLADRQSNLKIKQMIEKFSYLKIDPMLITQIIRYNINRLAKIINPDELEESIDRLISGLQDSYLFYILDQIIFGSSGCLLNKLSDDTITEYQNQTINGSIFDALTGLGKAYYVKADIAIDKIKKSKKYS